MIQYFLSATGILLIILLSFSLIRSVINIRTQQKKIKEQEEEYKQFKEELDKKTKKQKGFLLPKWD